MKTHKMHNTPEYYSWSAMKQRCLNVKCKDYAKYGAVGITVFSEWVASFESFYDEVGPRPEGTTLDRIDPYKGYFPGNVRWSTPKEQVRNRKDLVVVKTHAGLMPLVDYAALLGITKGAAHLRLKRGKLEGVIQ